MFRSIPELLVTQYYTRVIIHWTIPLVFTLVSNGHMSHDVTSTYVQVVLQLVGDYGTPVYAENYINRSSLDFSNGNLVVHNLTC